MFGLTTLLHWLCWERNWGGSHGPLSWAERWSQEQWICPTLSGQRERLPHTGIVRNKRTSGVRELVHESYVLLKVPWCRLEGGGVNRRFWNLTKLATELELPKLDSLVWQTGHSSFVRELNTKPIQLTSGHFINKKAITITWRTSRSRFTKNLLKNSNSETGQFGLANRTLRFSRDKLVESSDEFLMSSTLT
jgi:hypothetical protein